VLGLETGGEHVSVALLEVAAAAARDDEAAAVTLLDEVTSRRVQLHADVVMAHIDALLRRHGLAPKDLALVGVGRGPGGFTGVRVGLATALGLTLATGAPAWPVCSLAALACHVPSGPALVMLDARRGEVYAGLFDAGRGGPPEVVMAPAVGAAAALHAEALARAATPPLVIGSGAIAYGLASPVAPGCHVGAARHVAWLAARAWLAAGRDAGRAPALDAVYLRRSEAEIAADERERRAAVTAP